MVRIVRSSWSVPSGFNGLYLLVLMDCIVWFSWSVSSGPHGPYCLVLMVRIV
ncbi:hypothetical protein DPMN_194823 [Dreissena polymorpha]|uniref:Uncharacterized protein n=1 Tax=Dreissena polymorpha TaxID=45954 RepID=A0A9D4BF32_DREPO|nr:hypothetical protein DPMN_194823 [Dreissena polymorpha]